MSGKQGKGTQQNKNSKPVDDHQNPLAKKFPGLALQNDNNRAQKPDTEGNGRAESNDDTESFASNSKERRPNHRGPPADEKSNGNRDGRYSTGRSRDVDQRDDGQGKKDRPKTRELEVYSVYRGTVSNVKNFGAFVEIEGIPGPRKEGLVHISMISSSRAASTSSLLKRGQQVWVKVISISGSRIGLSMRDVNQETGEDLLPTRPKASAGDMAEQVNHPEEPRGCTNCEESLEI